MRRFSVVMLLLSGCALNAVRVDSGKDFAASSNAVVAQTRTYMNDVAARRRTANAALMASDASCAPIPADGPGRYAIYLRSPTGVTPAMTRSGRVPLCLTSDEIARGPRPGTYRMIDLNPLRPSALQARLTVLAAVADYAAALDKVTARKAPDLSGDLGGIAAKVDDLGTLAKAAGAGVPSATDTLATPEGKALIGILQFAAELAQEADQIRALRRLDADRGDAIDRGIDAIAADVDDFAYLDRNSVTTLAPLQARDYERSRAIWDYQRRTVAAQQLIAQEADLTASEASAASVRGAVGELKAAHRQYRALLRPDPALDPKTREKVRGIARARLWRALHLIAAAGAAFAGA